MCKNTSGKVKKEKHCALLDKPCLGDQCAMHYDMFEKCSLELIPYNMYPMTVAIQEQVEINHDLLDAIKILVSQLNGLSEQKKLFT